MPTTLIVFGDESHYDIHGSLKTLLLCFTLSYFNKLVRNSVDFWGPTTVIPTLDYGRFSGDIALVDKYL